jgi:glycosyltransferase involved in cell wall biosynthesis
MKVLLIFNHYRSGFGGEVQVVEDYKRAIEEYGHEVFPVERYSHDIRTIPNKVSAFGKGIYSFEAKRYIRKIIDQEHIDVVHIHNLYPLFSPSILAACKEHNVPVVMTVHNLGLICPIGLCLYKSKDCTKCMNGKEYWCIIRNCCQNIFKSLNYSLRNTVARMMGLFKNNVSCFIAPSNFIKDRLVAGGYPESRIVVLPNQVSMPKTSSDSSDDRYVAFAGRLETIKGVEILIAAARTLSEISFKIAGHGPIFPQLSKEAPDNVEFVGFLKGDELVKFYRGARFVVIPSLCFEALGLVALEAMSNGLPLIVSNRGALPEVIEEGVDGFLFEPGNHSDLADKIRFLWEKHQLCREMGEKAQEKVFLRYSKDIHMNKLINIYKNAMRNGKLGILF